MKKLFTLFISLILICTSCSNKTQIDYDHIQNTFKENGYQLSLLDNSTNNQVHSGEYDLIEIIQILDKGDVKEYGKIFYATIVDNEVFSILYQDMTINNEIYICGVKSESVPDLENYAIKRLDESFKKELKHLKINEDELIEFYCQYYEKNT